MKELPEELETKGNSLYNLSSFPLNLEVNSLEDIESLTMTWHEKLGHISSKCLDDLTRMSTGLPLLQRKKPCVCKICQKSTSVPS
jgi:hypothetical protein